MKICIVNLPYAYFSIDVENGIVVESAPIGRWMVGKKLIDIQNWVLKKNGVVKILEENL